MSKETVWAAGTRLFPWIHPDVEMRPSPVAGRGMFARREIATGEELTADYALWLYDVDWALSPCRCGSRLCRDRVSGQDWQRPELQERYAGHFTPFLNSLIDQRLINQALIDQGSCSAPGR